MLDLYISAVYLNLFLYLTLRRWFQLYFSRQIYYLHLFAWMADDQFGGLQSFFFRGCYHHWMDGLGFVQGLLSFCNKQQWKEEQEAFQDSKRSTLITGEDWLGSAQQIECESMIKSRRTPRWIRLIFGTILSCWYLQHYSISMSSDDIFKWKNLFRIKQFIILHVKFYCFNFSYDG